LLDPVIHLLTAQILREVIPVHRALMDMMELEKQVAHQLAFLDVPMVEPVSIQINACVHLDLEDLGVNQQTPLLR